MSEFYLDIPREIENLKLPDASLLQHYRDAKRRIIWVDYPITDMLMETVKQILDYNRDDVGLPREQRKPIHMFINSPGGDLYATYSCVDVMLLSETPIYTYNMGIAISGGFLLLLAGEKRYALRHSSAMFHKGSASFEGTAAEIEAATKHYQIQLKQMKEYIMERTSMDTRVYNKSKDSDGWLNAKDQVKLGVVDGIIESMSDIVGEEA